MHLAAAPRGLRRAAAGAVIAAALFAVLAWSAPAQPAPLRAHAAAICAEYPDQAAAQRAADTRDPDGDGLFCESLPCPCLEPGAGGQPPAPAPASPAPSQPTNAGCTTPAGVQPISFSATRYPRIRAHFRAAVRRGWPRTLVLNRRGADARRDRLLGGFPTRDGFDRDEYPPAVGRGNGKGLEREPPPARLEGRGPELGEPLPHGKGSYTDGTSCWDGRSRRRPSRS